MTSAGENLKLLIASCSPELQKYGDLPPGEGLGVIYAIANTVTGEIYIGQHRHGKSGRSVRQQRWNRHLKGESQNHLSHSVVKYGRKAFQCMILDLCTDEELNDQEIYLIAKWKTQRPYGFNNERGGGGEARSARGYEALVLANRTDTKRKQASEGSRKGWSDPTGRTERLANMKLAQNREDVKKANKKKSADYWANPDNRLKQSKDKKAYHQLEEVKAAVSKTRKKTWQNVEFVQRKRDGTLRRRQEALAKCTTEKERAVLLKRHAAADKHRLKLGRVREGMREE